MKIRSLLAAAMAVAALGAVPAGAFECPTVDDASAAAPHASDFTGDWNGVVTGNETALTPFGDIYREGFDLAAAWISREDGVLRANLEVADLGPAQPNSMFYILWDNPGSYRNPNSGAVQDATRRWVSARVKGVEVTYQWGYLGPGTTPTANATFVTIADTTGTLTPGPNGTISIVIPTGVVGGYDATDWGEPPAGSVLANVIGESRFLVGSPQQLPPNPSGLRHGYVYEIDVTDDENCGAFVP